MLNAGNPDLNILRTEGLEGKVSGLQELLAERLADNNDYNMIKYEQIDSRSIKLTARTRGDLAQLFTVADRHSHADVRNSLQVLGGEEFWRAGTTQFSYMLGKTGAGSETGLEAGSTTVVSNNGVNGSGLIAAQAMEKAEVRLQVNSLTGGIVQNHRIRIENGWDRNRAGAFPQ